MYVLGGHDCAHSRAEARVYDPATNSWSYISNLPWANYDYSAAIIKQKNDERWLVIQARYHHHLYSLPQYPRYDARYYHQIRYWNLDANNGWHHIADTGHLGTSKVEHFSEARTFQAATQRTGRAA